MFVAKLLMPYVSERQSQDVGEASGSDEDSFVILGSSPTPSMERYSNNFASGGTSESMSQQQQPREELAEPHVNSNNVASIDASSSLAEQQNQRVEALATPSTGSIYVPLADASHLSLTDSEPFSLISSLSTLSEISAPDLESVSPAPIGDFLLGESSGYAPNAAINPFVMRNSVVDVSKKSTSFHTSDWSTASKDLAENPLGNGGQKELVVCDKAESPKVSLRGVRSEISRSFTVQDSPEHGSNVTCVHQRLMDNLEKTNMAMTAHFEMVANFNQMVTVYKKDKLNTVVVDSQKFKSQIAQLENEIKHQSEVFALREKMVRVETEELVKELSNSKSIIMNMSETIRKLQGSTHSSDVLSLVAKPSISIASTSAGPVRRCNTMPSEAQSNLIDELYANIESKNFLIDDLEHKVAISFGDREMIDQMRDLIQKHTDRCVHLEELLRKSSSEEKRLRAQMVQQDQMLKATIKANDKAYENGFAENQTRLTSQIANMQKDAKERDDEIKKLKAEHIQMANSLEEESKHVLDCERVRTELENEMAMLREQLDIYKTDFDMERISRQDLASEREELLSDLKLLQRRNQELMNNASTSAGSTSTAAAASSAAKTAAPVAHKFLCPVCSRQYIDYKSLESHVNDCLLSAGSR